MTTKKKPSAQVEPAQKAAAIKAANEATRPQPNWLRREFSTSARNRDAAGARAAARIRSVAGPAAPARPARGMRARRRIVSDHLAMDDEGEIPAFADRRRQVEVAQLGSRNLDGSAAAQETQGRRRVKTGAEQ